ncbi:hypothetical protein Clacol_005225 [Clathrus columnatus]|uniref:Uncharacterized protein n=1 Tax=Clathrus columnatus TaxID=1419009 RepID=A0AAV5A8P1_9AGAM|nr:hypothetical protein Clacol_005225 [Clathrus columnatus]
MPSLTDIPVEIILDNLLPLFSLKDLLSLTLVNKDFSVVCGDDTFWKRKVNEDYNFPDASSARTKGYKFLYRGIHHSQVYIWGNAADSRLGLRNTSSSRAPILYSSVPYPRQLRIPDVRLVDIVAGGWSFHALDSDGNVYVWGKLNAENHALLNDPISISGRAVDRPVKLQLPERVNKLSCGRAHSMALTESNRVLVFTNWGTPYYLESPAVHAPIQVECGWAFSAILSRTGEVYIWWPFKGLFKEQIRQHGFETEQRARQGQRIAIPENNVVECVTWEITTDPYLLYDVVDELPKLQPDAKPDHTKIVKIAAGDDFLIGLTKGGHVLKVDFTGQNEDFTGPAMMRPRWRYLSRFSEVESVKELPELKNETESLDSLHMTHISAHFNSFFAYSTGSSSIVLRGFRDTAVTTPPDIIPGLQNRDVIAVVLGDYHFAALTSTGKLFTWGQYSSGALGLGDPTRLPIGTPGAYSNERDKSNARVSPPHVPIPTEVKFGTRDYGQGRNIFVFGVTACGWHTGALVIDLDDPEYEQSEEEGDSTRSAPTSIEEPGAFPTPIFRRPFRIGLAGAFAGRGRGGGADG